MNKIENALKNMSEAKWNYWLSFIYDGAIAILLMIVAYMSGMEFFTGLIFFFSGVIFFTLIEYVVHAHLFHGPLKSFVKAHAKHHKDPHGYDAMPFFFAQFIIAPFFGLAILLFGSDIAMIFTSGVFAGYIAYGLMHHAMHRVNPTGKYFSYMVAFHDQHHTNPKMNHGVTVPFWDMVFGTFTPLKK
jgi:dihydroceramide fatty acyl 2-hydroxylase